ncbi:aldehyde:ferredoxin oxidoreductase [Clostridiales bacterium PH28_bin88]|nr:aldehyde:ferredoxin oxidoreductase [Clostridiales bacterium PH28_bin88]
MGTFTAKLVEIDLSTGKIAALITPDHWSRDFIGGRGLGARMLWERQPRGVDPLGPEAEMYILAGPLTGIVPGGAQICLVFKSPLTQNTIGYSLTGANWGTELRSAGWDGLILKGSAPTPVYLLIKNDRVELRDAGHLWGRTTFETEKILKEEIKDPFARVLSIGPAGENLVRFASVQQESFRSAARGGTGCVWGAKGLKAIIVRGTGPIPVNRPEEAFLARRKIERALIESRTTVRRAYDLVRWGGSITHLPHSDEEDLDVRNYQEGTWEEIDKVGGLAYELRCRAKTRGCFGCPVSCMPLGVIREGTFSGKIVCPDLDSTSTIGPGCLVNDLESMVYLSRWGDEQGIDTTSLGNVTGFAMECYEKGLLTLSDLDGIDLKWGSVPAMLALWQKIVRREGIGDLLAQGVRNAAKVIGGGAGSFAMHVKGLEFAGFTPKAHRERGLEYAVADRGAAHHFGSKTSHLYQRTWADCLTVCTWQRRMITPEMYIDLLHPVTGWDIGQDEWPVVAERILLTARSYNIREGTVPLRDDVLPERVHHEPMTKGKQAGAVYPKEQFVADRLAWYQERGCDAAGIPTAERLRALGLDFVIPDMEAARSPALRN